MRQKIELPGTFVKAIVLCMLDDAYEEGGHALRYVHTNLEVAEKISKELTRRGLQVNMVKPIENFGKFTFMATLNQE